MTIEQIIQIITLVLGLLGIVSFGFNIYRGYQKEQERDGDKIIESEKVAIALSSKLDLFKTEVLGKVETSIASMGGDMKGLLMEMQNIKMNHLHTIEEKQRDQDAQIGKLTVSVEKLQTIIDERVPRKTVEQVS